MDYIQQKLVKSIEKSQRRQSGKYSTIVGYYNVLIQYILYLMFACIWDKREPELPRTKRMKYLQTMKRATLGTILHVIMELESDGAPILGLDKVFQQQILEFIKLRNTETAHGILVPGVHEESYKKIADEYEKAYQTIQNLDIPILMEECRMYYMSNEQSLQATVFNKDDYDYQYLSSEIIKALDMQPQELYYYFGNTCYKISPFLLLRELPTGDNPYEIYCYQEYNLKNGKFEYKRYSDLSENISYSVIYRDYFLSFQEEFTHTICKANGVICNKFENNYDYFISTPPINTHVQIVWDFIKRNKSNACLTIRGGGGIGKTALVQYICTKNIFDTFEIGAIQYVVFCSAKDQEFRQSSGLTGHIRSIQRESIIKCYKDIIQTIGWVLDTEDNLDTEQAIENVENKLIRTSGILLIIDDFETLSENDKKRVVKLSSKLDVSKHKMLITTRSQYMVGEEYYIESLNKDQTLAFMRERFKQSCPEPKCEEFNLFCQKQNIADQIFTLTRGLPLLSIQLGNLLVFNGCKESALAKRDDEETEEFLLGRLYTYFGTQTSKILFLIIANFNQFNNEEIGLPILRIVYTLCCDKLKIANVDFEQDIQELKKLNIINVESDFIRISNYISSSILRKCWDNLKEDLTIQMDLFDKVFFKTLSENGLKEGILIYTNLDCAQIDYPFIKTFAFDNLAKYTTDIRFLFIEKYLVKYVKDNNAARDLFNEACKFLDIPSVETKFLEYGKKYGYIIPELEDRRDIHISEDIISIDYYIEEVRTEFENTRNIIDDFLEIRRTISPSLCLEKTQDIRGKLGSICNLKLERLLKFDLNGYERRLKDIAELMEEISFTKEFNLCEYEQYIKLCEIIG